MPIKLRIIIIALFSASMLLIPWSYAHASAGTTRIAGEDRYKTAIAISQKGWPGGSQYAVLTTSENFPDALSAAPLAKKYNAPILLTGSGSINSDTAAELKRLKVRQVYIIGGTGVISQNVETGLKSMISGLTITRISGADRYETAVNVAQAVGYGNGIIVATGKDFADAMSAAPVAAKKGMPIILVSGNDVAPSVKEFLSGKKFSVSYIIDSGLSDRVCSYFENAVKIPGNSKYERNINIINTFSDDLDLNSVYVATGENYPDALGAAVLAAATSSPVILTDNSVPQATRDFLMSNVITDISVIGGSGAVSYTAENIIKELPAYVYSIEDTSLSVVDGEKYELPKTVTATVCSKIYGYQTLELPVAWSLLLMDADSTTYTGTVRGYAKKAVLRVNVEAVPASKSIAMSAQVVQYGRYVLPATAPVKFTNGTYQDMPVTWNTGTVPLNKIGTIQVKGVVDGYNTPVTLTIGVLEDKAVTINDATFRRIIYNNLGYSSQTRALYISDLLSMTSLKYNGSGTISSLAGIEKMTNLTYLELNNVTINSLSGLQNLKNLKTLKLKGDEIKDISSLKTLTNLEYVDLSYNCITNISALKDLTRIRILYLAGNSYNDTYLTDYSPIRGYYDNLAGKDFTYSSN